jgi:hypothetical protein
MIQKIIDLIAKIFGIKRKDPKKKKDETDDIYPMW